MAFGTADWPEMQIPELLASPDTRLIYKNYNAVYLFERSIVVKQYADHWRLEREVLVNRLLKGHGFELVQDVLGIAPPYVAFAFVDDSTYADGLRCRSMSVNRLVSSLECLPRALPGLEILQDDERLKRWLWKTTSRMHSAGALSTAAAHHAEEVIWPYRAPELQFVHGDLRPDNIVGHDSVKCVIDWECAEYGDINRDFAYMYFGTVLHDATYAKPLTAQISRLPGFSESSFTFFLTLIYCACWENPRVEKAWVIDALHALLTPQNVSA